MKTSLRGVVVVLIPTWMLMFSTVNTNIVNINPTSVAVMSATPSEIREGLTKDLSLNCTFSPGSEIGSVVSIILSKADHFDGGTFTEIAEITTVTHTASTHNSLGGQVSGKLLTNGESYLAYEWTYPKQDVVGRYQCSVFGIDPHGHPKVSTVTTDIKEQVVDFATLLAKLMELEKSQTAQDIKIQEQGKIINEQNIQLNELYSRLNNSRSALMVANSSYGGHDYYLSQNLWRNHANDDSICRMLGGYLLILDDEQEFKFVENFLMNISPIPTTILTGVTEGGHTGTWTALHSGSPVSYLNWGPHQPDKTAGYTCVFLAKAYGWKMSDGPCHRADWEQFVCEVPT